ncbi:amino acid permease [Streptomyces sp. NPDC006668]|uniref:amino acid permease n=1 Tax=Streptomyces sp. NPDC006668 TaxID=3156903 RepID=UPI0033FC5420
MSNIPKPDESTLEGFGYRQELRRVLRTFAVFAVSFSIVSITTGIFLNYGFGITHLGPASIWLWPVAVVGQLLVALVIAELSTRMPLAGANYQWGARLVGPRYGWFIGALGILYAAVGLPAIMLEGLAPLFASVLGWDAANPRLTLFIALAALVIAYLINLISVQLAARVNNIAVFTEIIGTVILGVLLFVLWVARYKPHGQPVHFLANHQGMFHQPFWYAAILAGLMGVFTLVGFEAAADMSEETVNAQRAIPKAILWSVGLSGVLGMVALICFTLAVPDLHTVQNAPAPLVVIAEHWLGGGLTRIFLILVVFSMFALAIVAATTNARLIYAMSRDNMLPFSGMWRRIHIRTRTPVPALLAGLAIGVLMMIYGYAQGNAFGTLVSATALIPYIIYLFTVIAYAVRRRTLTAIPGAFSLGRFGTPVMVIALVWLAAVILTLALPSEFRSADYIIVGWVVLAAVWYFAALRKRLREGVAAIDLSRSGQPSAADLPGTPAE